MSNSLPLNSTQVSAKDSSVIQVVGDTRGIDSNSSEGDRDDPRVELFIPHLNSKVINQTMKSRSTKLAENE